MTLVFDWIITEINPGEEGYLFHWSDQSKILHIKKVTHLPHYNV